MPLGLIGNPVDDLYSLSSSQKGRCSFPSWIQHLFLIDDSQSTSILPACERESVPFRVGVPACLSSSGLTIFKLVQLVVLISFIVLQFPVQITHCTRFAAQVSPRPVIPLEHIMGCDLEHSTQFSLLKGETDGIVCGLPTLPVGAKRMKLCLSMLACPLSSRSQLGLQPRVKPQCYMV